MFGEFWCRHGRPAKAFPKGDCQRCKVVPYTCITAGFEQPGNTETPHTQTHGTAKQTSAEPRSLMNMSVTPLQNLPICVCCGRGHRDTPRAYRFPRVLGLGVGASNAVMQLADSILGMAQLHHNAAGHFTRVTMAGGRVRSSETSRLSQTQKT